MGRFPPPVVAVARAWSGGAEAEEVAQRIRSGGCVCYVLRVCAYMSVSVRPEEASESRGETPQANTDTQGSAAPGALAALSK